MRASLEQDLFSSDHAIWERTAVPLPKPCVSKACGAHTAFSARKTVARTVYFMERTLICQNLIQFCVRHYSEKLCTTWMDVDRYTYRR